jgi:hypothetical protein
MRFDGAISAILERRVRPIWIQLLVLLAGAILLWFERSARLKSTNEERRRKNWSTVPIMAFAVASALVMIHEGSGIRASHVIYSLLFLAAYTGFVYRWNRLGVDDD